MSQENTTNNDNNIFLEVSITSCYYQLSWNSKYNEATWPKTTDALI